MSFSKSTVCTFIKTKGSVKQNSNGKSYMWCDVEINGTTFPAMIYEKSLDLVAEGEVINADLRQLPDSDIVQITVWHPDLATSNTPLPTVADFEALFAPKKPASPVASATAK